jgi:hypothetical protein
MLKKFSHIILSSLLLVSTMGVVVSKHYCGGAFVSASIFHEAKSCCDAGDCCHNEDSFFKVEDDFSAPVVFSVPILAELDILGFNLFDADLLLSPETGNPNPFYADSPPPPTIQKALSLKQVYRL